METSDIIALSAALIAGCALYVTIWQTRVTHRHNRLSVRPAIVWHREFSTTKDGTEITFRLSNCGSGPAFVQDRYFLLNDQRFTLEQQFTDEVHALAETLLVGKSNYHLRQHGLPGTEATIPQNGEHVIARIFFPGAPRSAVESLLSELGMLKFCLHYQSLYNEPFVLER